MAYKLSITDVLKLSSLRRQIFVACIAGQSLVGSARAAPADSAAILLEMAANADISEFVASVGPEDGQQLLHRFNARFTGGPATAEPSGTTPDRIIRAYRNYWAAALMKRESREVAENSLFEELQSLSGSPASDHDWSVLLPRVQREFNQRGLKSHPSPPAPLADLLVWSREHSESFSVPLWDQDREVEVVFVDDLLSAGWFDYASLGLGAVSGWTDGARLYTPSWAYDTGSEAFRVSFLAHEAQHLADLERFPGISLEDLEYRGKLAELALVRQSTRTLLERFSMQNPGAVLTAHAAADLRVAEDVRSALCAVSDCDANGGWTSASYHAVNRAAHRLLRGHTQSLEAQEP
jgi:hypothetical protein